MARRLIARLSMTFVLALALALGVGAGTAAGANGPAYCGALNMVHDPTMLAVPMERDNENGNIGMATAVANSCP